MEPFKGLGQLPNTKIEKYEPNRAQKRKFLRGVKAKKNKLARRMHACSYTGS